MAIKAAQQELCSLITFQSGTAPARSHSDHLLYCEITMARKISSNNHADSRNGPLRSVAHAELPTRYGRFTIYGFEGSGPQEEAIALVRGNLKGRVAPLVRVHSQCLTGDVLTSLR